MLEPAYRIFTNIDPHKTRNQGCQLALPSPPLQLNSAGGEKKTKQTLSRQFMPLLCCDCQKLLILQINYPEFILDYCTMLHSSKKGKWVTMPIDYINLLTSVPFCGGKKPLKHVGESWPIPYFQNWRRCYPYFLLFFLLFWWVSRRRSKACSYVPIFPGSLNSF